MSTSFKALIVEKSEDKQFSRHIGERTIDELPEGEILIKVQYSSLNYKDALSATGNPGVSRIFPHTPGIDAAGTVVESQSDAFKKGDEVIVTSYDLGMNTAGGLGQYIRVPQQWVLKRPQGLTAKEAMGFGTAGLTAALMISALQSNGVTPEKGPVLVTGATGGVGSIAVSILSKLGFNVTAATGKASAEDFLKRLGASEVINRETLLDNSRPMFKEHWAGVVDVVAGDTLANAIKSCQYNGVVTASGLVGAVDFTTSIFPFILRGVRLIGIDSVECSMDVRTQAWQALASDYKVETLESLVTEITLDQAESSLLAMLKGQSHGRIVVNMENS
ncbi:oxidoreductase [Reinekea marina]|uniref:Oxidoreductase n=1 Tax=Reinekea marina TaxID=1310421 RepID=A0ABV7WVJ4_9GAMM|nr:oxidoreductase [Reinekea marina]MDN3647535.1 oxidoreductase [Reinekea marina]MDN3651104.1 oxidoreductase [Reinekea marina]